MNHRNKVFIRERLLKIPEGRDEMVLFCKDLSQRHTSTERENIKRYEKTNKEREDRSENTLESREFSLLLIRDQEERVNYEETMIQRERI